jgi:hypothetical protein
MSPNINAKSRPIRKAFANSSLCVVYALMANEPTGPQTGFDEDCGDYFFATFGRCSDNSIKEISITIPRGPGGV